MPGVKVITDLLLEEMPKPEIQNPHRLDLSETVKNILTGIFESYRQIVIEEKFCGGFSSGQIFKIRPFKDQNSNELPAVIKVAPTNLIKQEIKAYRDYIERTLPHTATIQGPVVFYEDEAWGGIRYSLVGSDIFEIASLYQYCRDKDIEDIRFTLARLFEIMGHHWRHHQTQLAFSLQSSYDHLLPVNFMIQPADLPPEPELTLLNAARRSYPVLKPGSYVRLAGFMVTEVDRCNQEVTFNLPPASNDDQLTAFRLRLTSVKGIERFRVGRIIQDPITGVVVKNRYDLLKQYAQEALGQQELSGDTVTLTIRNQTLPLPNPLHVLPGLLRQPLDVKVAVIHGDPNLQNVLVDMATRDVTLIDFATARRDHVLHDFLRLETGIVTQLLPEMIAGTKISVAETIYTFYQRLHKTVLQTDTPFVNADLPSNLEKIFKMLVFIRQTARQYLFNFDDFAEYYRGLAVYLLAALKFKELESVPKQVAFWGAATIQQFIKEPPVSQPATSPAPFPVVKTPTGVRAIGCFYENRPTEQEIRTHIREVAQIAGLHLPEISDLTQQNRLVSLIAQEKEPEIDQATYQRVVKILPGRDYCVYLLIISASDDSYCASLDEVTEELTQIDVSATPPGTVREFDLQIYVCREIPNISFDRVEEVLPTLFADQSRPDAAGRLGSYSIPLICAYWSHLSRYVLIPALPANISSPPMIADQNRVVSQALDDLARFEIYRHKLDLSYKYYQRYYDSVEAMEIEINRQIGQLQPELKQASKRERQQMLDPLNEQFMNLSQVALAVTKYSENLAQPNLINLKRQLESWAETPIAGYPTLSSRFLPEAEQIATTLAQFSKRIVDVKTTLNDLLATIRN